MASFKALGLSLVASISLFAATADSTYVKELISYLQNSEFTIDGRYYMYDFNHNGKIEANDWLFVASNGEPYQLFGDPQNGIGDFKWKKLDSIPQDIDLAHPSALFSFINFPLDQERYHTNAYSWIVIANNDVYKLMDKKEINGAPTFDYLDIDGDSIPDPLPDLTPQIQGSKILFAATQSTTPKTLLFYGFTDQSALGGIKNIRIIDPANPTQILYQNDDTTDVRRPAITTTIDSYDPATHRYSGLKMKYVHFVSQGVPYKVDLTSSPNPIRTSNATLNTSRQLRYTDIEYLGTKQYLTAKTKDGKEVLITPEMGPGDTPLPFTGKSLVDVTYPSYGAAIDGYLVEDEENKKLQKCSLDMQRCTDILTYDKSLRTVGNVQGSTKLILLVDGDTYAYDRATNQATKLAVVLPPRVGHTTPYALNKDTLYYVKDGNLYKYNLNEKQEVQISSGLKAARIRLFTDDMVIIADDDYIYAAKKDGSTPKAMLLSQMTETRGHKYDYRLAGTSKYYIYNTFALNPDTGKMLLRACLLEGTKVECKDDSFWANVMIAQPEGTMDFDASYYYTPYKFVRVDNTDNYGGGTLKAVSADNPLEDGITLGTAPIYNFQTFVNSGYKNEFVNEGGYVMLNAKHDLKYKGETFLANLDQANSLINITNEPIPSDDEINGGRSHCHGRYCATCHSFAGGKLYASWDSNRSKYKDLSKDQLGKYTVQFRFADNTTLRAVIKKGQGENFNTPLENLVGKDFTAEVVNIETGEVTNHSDELSHKGAEYFDCNYCHYRYGPRNDAPGVITVEPIE
ncbi:MAG: hypothetical protein C6H99_01370 [Epsilonproteobacteria bacterium]|nr:hypothetical protein [Campylobacterota bacterium]NPA64597.1 hypothetical protein [Campylobacterota bacterium]